ncbi:MAG: hypothetical protein WCR06_06655 [bacterium]
MKTPLVRTQNDKPNQQAWALAVTAAFLFALGGVATWAQEFYVWIPQRAATISIVFGLACSLGAMILTTRVIFSGAVLAGRQNRAMLWTTLLAAVPPLAFLAWVLWMRISLAESL